MEQPVPHTERYDGHADINNLGNGNSYYIASFLTLSFAVECFQRLLVEIPWRVVYARGKEMARLKQAFADIAADGTYPCYRYPFMFYDVCDWHPLIREIRNACQTLSAFPLNHCISTAYRDGTASISRHSDKVIDLQPGSHILDVSLGTPRLFRLASNCGQRVQEIMLQPGSLLVLDWETNLHWTHEVPKALSVRDPRISLVFRPIVSKYDSKTRTVTESSGRVYYRPRSDRADEDLGKPRPKG